MQIAELPPLGTPQQTKGNLTAWLVEAGRISPLQRLPADFGTNWRNRFGATQIGKLQLHNAFSLVGESAPFDIFDARRSGPQKLAGWKD